MKTLAAVEKAAAPFPGREQLAEAHRARQVADSALEKAKATLEKGTQGVQDAEANLETFSGLDERLARARADMVKHGKSGPLPSSLVSERTQRNGAKERLEESKGALMLLEAERVAAEKALREATQAHSHQAFLVLLGQATALSKKLAGDQERVWEGLDRLKAWDHWSGASHVPTDGARHAVMYSKEWQTLISPLVAAPPLVVAYSPHDPVRAEVERWKALHAALLNNPNASIGSV